MEYRMFGDTVILRLDPGDEMLESLLLLAEREGVALAQVSGIGGSDDITLGVWNGVAYDPVHLDTVCEITSVAGNLSTMNGMHYAHIHLTCAQKGGRVTGGHLLRCVISLTGELILHVIPGSVGRVRDERLMINRLDLGTGEEKHE